MDKICQYSKLMENEKELRVLEAAKTVFLRYGFRRVTMQDIAEAAGISRPALYLIYPNKEEVFKAAIRQMAAENIRQIREDLSANPTIESKLQQAFEIWSVGPFRIMLNSPDAKDLIDCTHGFARAEMEEITWQFNNLLIEILAPHIPHPLTNRLSSNPIDAQQIAQILNAAIHSFKDSAATVPELQSMIKGLITLTIAGMQSLPASQP